MPSYTVTYDLTDPDDTDSGDYAESGFVVPNLGDVEFPSDIYGDAAAQWQSEMGVRVAIDPEDWFPYPEEEPSAQMATCRAAARMILDGGYTEDNGDSWYWPDAAQDMHTGMYRRQAIHFSGFTPADADTIRALVRAGNAGADL